MEVLQPKLRFPEFDGNWESKTLGSISSRPKYGLNSSATEYDGINGYVRITDIDELSRKFLRNKITSPEGFDDSYLLDSNDLLFTRTGASTGKTYLYDVNDGKLFFAGFLIKFNITDANSKFVFYQTLLSKYDKWVKVMSMRSGQPGINAEEYSVLPINLTKIEEQTKIANFLSSVDEKLNLLKEKKSLLEEYKKGIMQKIFNQEIRFKDDNGNDFEDWEEMSLGSMCKITTGKLDANAMVEDGEYRFYTCAKDYYRIDKYAFDTEALLISGNGANVGYIHYYRGKFNAYQRTYILDGFEENITYVKFYLQMFLPKRIKGEKNDGNTPYIVLSTLSKMEFLIPSIKEQTKIANFLSAIDEKIELVSNQIQDTQEYKKGLLQQMFV